MENRKKIFKTKWPRLKPKFLWPSTSWQNPVSISPYVVHMKTYLPSFEAHTRMKTCIVKHAWIHKRHTQIRHAREFNNTINLQKT